jgi:hypothetical protein
VGKNSRALRFGEFSHSLGQKRNYSLVAESGRSVRSRVLVNVVFNPTGAAH